MKDKLVNSHMIDLFANSGWKDGLVTGNSFYLKKINELHNRLSQLQIVEQFHYISNPNSRGRKINCVMRCFSFKLIGRGSASAKGVHQHSRRA